MQNNNSQQLYSLNSRPKFRILARTISDAERALQGGAHLQSMNLADRLALEHRGDDVATSIALAIHARNRLHVDDNAGAMQCLMQIRSDTRAASAYLDGQCFMVAALLQKRAARTLWKEGKIPEACAALKQSISACEAAEQMGVFACHHLSRLNSRLNRIYAEGLLAAINGESQKENPRLMAEAIVLEQEIRMSTPPNARDDLPGLTIIADLARGAGLSLAASTVISSEEQFEVARRNIFIANLNSWPDLLLEAVRQTDINNRMREIPVRPEIVARALVLGSRILLDSDSSVVQAGIATAFQVRLIHTLLQIQRETQAERPITHLIRTAIKALDCFSPRPFAGRRSLR